MSIAHCWRGSSVLLFIFLFTFPHPAHASNLGLVGYWTFDDATGTQATDFSGNGNIGTLTGSTLPTWTSGKHGKALSFDGSTSYVDIPMTITSSAFTVSAWFKASSLSSSNARIVANSHTDSDQKGFQLMFRSGGASGFFDVGTGSSEGRADWNQQLSTNTWYHYVGTYDGANPHVYINGVKVDGGGSFPVTGSIAASGFDVNIGRNPAYAGDYFPGTIDDVRVYNRALSATEVAKLYTAGATLHKPPNNLGLVGYWSFDDGTGTQATDFSGNGNTGTTSATWVSGKHNKALSLNGTSNVVNVPYSSSLDFAANQDFTVVAWVKTSQATAFQLWPNIISHEDGISVRQGYGLVLHNSNSDARWYLSTFVAGTEWQVFGTNNIADGKWHHIVGLRSGSNIIAYEDGVFAHQTAASSGSLAKTIPLAMGDSAAENDFTYTPYNGLVDDVRIYNRAFGASEVAKLYQTGAVQANASSATLENGTTLGPANGLVGLWTFDGKDTNWRTGQELDESGNGNTGSLVNMSTSTSPTAGHLGQALSFNGSSSYVDTNADIFYSDTLTVCAWFNAGVFGSTEKIIVAKRNISGITDLSNIEWELEAEPAGAGGTVVPVYYSKNSAADALVLIGSTVLSTNTWYHECAVQNGNGNTGYLYLNGRQEVSAVQATTMANTSDVVQIGVRCNNDDNRWWNGKIDDVRIYNRALSPAEVQQLYKLGTATIHPN